MRPLYGVFATLIFALGGCAVASADFAADGAFQRERNTLLPTVSRDEGHLGSGHVDGRGPTQPIAYSHNTHVETLGMQCEYCHSVARRSRHAGVPPAQACMGCHKYVKADSPRLAKLKAEIMSCPSPACRTR